MGALVGLGLILSAAAAHAGALVTFQSDTGNSFTVITGTSVQQVSSGNSVFLRNGIHTVFANSPSSRIITGWSANVLEPTRNPTTILVEDGVAMTVSWTAGDVTVEVETVDSDLECAELAGLAIADCRADVSFVAGPRPRIKLISIDLVHPTSPSPGPDAIDLFQEEVRLFQLLPAAGEEPETGTLALPFDDAIPWDDARNPTLQKARARTRQDARGRRSPCFSQLPGWAVRFRSRFARVGSALVAQNHGSVAVARALAERLWADSAENPADRA